MTWLALLGLLTVAAVQNDEQERVLADKLMSCPATSLASAVRCLEQSLTRAQRRELIAARWEFARNTSAGDAAKIAWNGSSAAFKSQLEQDGLPVSANPFSYGPGDFVAETLWLKVRRCNLDHQARIRDAQARRRYTAEVWALQQDPEYSQAHFGAYRSELQPSCPAPSGRTR